MVGSEVGHIPAALWVAPAGTHRVLESLAVSPTLHQATVAAFLLLCAAVSLGYRSRPAAVFAAVLGLYALGVPHLTGKVDHYHHVIWFLVLVALSPSDDALAIRPSGKTHTSEAYATASLAAGLILGTIYLTAALPKLETGIEWALSDNFRNIMWYQWYEKQHVPFIRIDRWPVVYQALAVFALGFELLFLPSVLFRIPRRVAALAGFFFHLGTWILLSINFLSLLVLYVVLFDWDKAPQRGRISAGASARAVMPMVLALVIAAGSIDKPNAGWPLASYPGFSGISKPQYTEYVLVDESRRVPITRSGLAERYGSHRVRYMAAYAMARGTERILLEQASQLDAVLYTGVGRTVVSTDPELSGQVIEVLD